MDQTYGTFIIRLYITVVTYTNGVKVLTDSMKVISTTRGVTFTQAEELKATFRAENHSINDTALSYHFQPDSVMLY